MTQASNIVLGNSGVDTSIGDQLLSIQNRQQALQRRQQQDNDDMVQYMTRELDFSKFATGTEADPVVNESLNGIYTELSNRIKSNKGESMASIYADLGQKINKLKGYTTGVKTLRDGINANTEAITKNAKDVDGNVLRRRALSKALFKIDPTTGQPVLKDPEEIDLQQDYVGGVVKDNGDEVFQQSSGYWQKIINDTKGVPQFANTGDDWGGVKTTKGWKAEIKPFEEYVLDPKTKQPTGIQIKYEVKKDASGKPVIGKDGKEIRMMPKEIYDKMIGGTENEWRVRADLKRQGKINGQYIDPDTPEGDEMKRMMAYDYFNAFRPKGEFGYTDRQDRDAWLSKQQAGGTVIKNYIGGGDKPKGGEVNYVEAYKEIDEITKQKFDEKKPYTQANLLPTKSFEAVIKIARERVGVPSLGAKNIKLVRDKDGNIDIYSTDAIRTGTEDNPKDRWPANTLIARLDKTGVDLKVNTRAKEQTQIVKEGNKKKQINRSDIKSRAAAAGYSAKEYEQMLIKNNVEIINN